jgi:hypothetical protein
MMDNMLGPKKFAKAEWIGFIVASILAPLFHFTFEASGGNTFVGLFSAVNESVWEHTKILYFPFLFYTIAEYFIIKPNAKRFWASKAVAMAFIPVVMIVFFYTYTGMFGAESLAVDIASTFVWLFFAFLISYKLYRSDYDLEKHFGWFVFLLIAVFAVEILFTLYPPRIPLFMDSITGGYGFPL